MVHGHIFGWMNGDDYYIKKCNKSYTHFVPAVFVLVLVTYMYYTMYQFLIRKKKKEICLVGTDY